MNQKLLEAILLDEMEYCFDKSYCSDSAWAEDNPDETRGAAFEKIYYHWSNASVEDVREFFGDKYDYIIGG